MGIKEIGKIIKQLRFRQIGEKSYATSFPNDGSIYLEKVYSKGEHGNLKLVENSNGILIAEDHHMSIPPRLPLFFLLQITQKVVL
jgi:hypothetical protein